MKSDALGPVGSPRYRVIVVGASNVTRGMATVATSAVAALGGPADVLVAAGRGRSYGAWSRVLARSVPSILESGLWSAAARGAAPSHALVTDVGNDLLYGQSPERVLGWVDEVLARLAALGCRTVVVRLPMARLERVSPLGYSALARCLFFGRTVPSLSDVLSRARTVQAGLAELASRRGAAVVDPAPEWYGLDPIHLRVSRHAEAWSAMFAPWRFGGPARPAPGGWLSALRLCAALPQRGRLCGVAFGGPEARPGTANCGGAQVLLY